MIFTRSLSLNSKLSTKTFKSCSKCGVIYKINKITYSCYEKYIGKTRRRKEVRIKEHQADANNEKSLEKIVGLSSVRKWTYI